MPSDDTSQKTRPSEAGEQSFLTNLARAYGGAILFSFPMLMTMEMWWLGFYMNGLRLALFTLLTIPLLIGVSFFEGFEDTFTRSDDVRETFIAYAVGFSAAALMLYLFGVIKPGMSADEVIGKISVQAVGASLGAMFAQSLLGGGGDAEKHAERRKRSTSYAGQLFLTAVGAIFLSMSVSPTEEMTLIAYQMTDWHTLGLAILTIMMMHAFVYAVAFRGFENELSAQTPGWKKFLKFTVVGYAIVLVISFYVLWTFGSIDGMPFPEQIKAVVVLGFPAAIGASASRLIL